MLLGGKIVPKARFAMTEGHCFIQLGVWGHCKPPADPEQSPGGDPGGEGPGNTEDLILTKTG